MINPILIKSGDKLTYLGDLENYFMIWLLEQDDDIKLRFKQVLDFDIKIKSIIKSCQMG